MSSILEALISELLYGPTRTHRERATPEQIERNKREIAIQNEINERAYRRVRPDTSLDSADNADQPKRT